jgi:hypothetical protein
MVTLTENNDDFAPGYVPTCIHCKHVFEKPFNRRDHLESMAGTLVLECPYCNLFTCFVEEGIQTSITSREGARLP